MNQVVVIFFNARRYRTGPLNEYIGLLRFAEQSSSPRTTFQYNNDMYIVAGELVEAVSGQSWGAFVQEHILSPLGMRETKMDMSDNGTAKSLAQPHGFIGDKMQSLRPNLFPSMPAGAGSMMSNVSDMSRWMISLLDSTRAGDTTLLQPESFSEIFSTQMHLKEAYYPAARITNPFFASYGLGWFLLEYQGHFVAMHTGSLVGTGALIALLPEEQLGVVVFANSQSPELRHALMYDVLDRYLGTSERDWSVELLELYQDLNAQSEQRWQARKRVMNTKPTLDLSAYIGEYADDIYGTLRVSEEAGNLVMRLGPFIADLEHWHYDTFLAIDRGPWGLDKKNPTWPGSESWYPHFLVDESGEISGVELPLGAGRRLFERLRQQYPRAKSEASWPGLRDRVGELAMSTAAAQSITRSSDGLDYSRFRLITM